MRIAKVVYSAQMTHVSVMAAPYHGELLSLSVLTASFHHATVFSDKTVNCATIPVSLFVLCF